MSLLVNRIVKRRTNERTDVNRYMCVRQDRTTPQSGHYPITGWAHASGDSNFNCSCSLIGIMRFTTDTDIHLACQHWAEGNLFDNDINIWNDQSSRFFFIVFLTFLSFVSFSFLFFIKIRYFHINMWLLLSLPDVSIILTREQHIFNLLIP